MPLSVRLLAGLGRMVVDLRPEAFRLVPALVADRHPLLPEVGARSLLPSLLPHEAAPGLAFDRRGASSDSPSDRPEGHPLVHVADDVVSLLVGEMAVASWLFLLVAVVHAGLPPDRPQAPAILA